MTSYISLAGVWGFFEDQQKKFTDTPPQAELFHDTIPLPGTTAHAKKGKLNTACETGYLTELYPYHGNAWFRRTVTLPEIPIHRMTLLMERTRVSEVWVNGTCVGCNQSLCTPHLYYLSEFTDDGVLDICIRVDNSDYPTKGGHMTSPDTQTNWNGILGNFLLKFHDAAYIDHVKAISDAKKREVRLEMRTSGLIEKVCVSHLWQDINTDFNTADFRDSGESAFDVSYQSDGKAVVTVPLGDDAPLWDEYHPTICRMCIHPKDSSDKTTVTFGLTDFKVDGMHFSNHGIPVFLRGKHDGMIFPISGAAPMDVNAWIELFRTAKSYGINLYRFHTCCPPEAAFEAADLVGMYLAPEIPFWGTLTSDDGKGCSPEEFEYLKAEGKRILDAFGNHPSFAMFSLGNELWGGKDKIREMLQYFKQDEKRILFTQGCNNFQFWPCIFPEDDFFVGVRLDRERLLRGSYAMCDRPLGHVQTQRPSAMHCYDGMIRPDAVKIQEMEDAVREIEIQYETGVKKVQLEQDKEFLIPEKPVITHEIGQYCSYPNFNEISKYTGVLRARNFEVFRKRLEDKGMLDMADKFFHCSGQLAVQCYKEELEAVMRSEHIAGFHILDIQDFSGQGTALVGILDAFMESKGFITPERWRGFCSDSVLLAQFPSYILTSGEMFDAQISLRHYAPETVHAPLVCKLYCNDTCISEETFDVSIHGQGLFPIGTFAHSLPQTDKVCRLTLVVSLPHTENTYDLWLYPKQEMPELHDERLCVTNDWTIASNALADGRKVLFLPYEIEKSIEGFYCTDFWCYPMFRSISESLERPVPVGTLGLCIQNDHPALADFPCMEWTTPQWYDLVTHANCAILDDTNIRPIVQMIDNFERNHRLGILFECSVGAGSLLVCTSRLSEISDRPEAMQFAKSILRYASSDDFSPVQAVDKDILSQIFG
ncbi:MAG: beta-glucuronidase [Ruminococcus sp.]|nr:beta-glucuronidase [Ruminococcus sp.]